MLVQLRKPKEETQAESDRKVATALNALEQTVYDIAHLPEAVELANLGDFSDLNAIYKQVEKLRDTMITKPVVLEDTAKVGDRHKAVVGGTPRTVFVRPSKEKLRNMKLRDMAGAGEHRVVAKPTKWSSRPIVESGLHELVASTLRDLDRGSYDVNKLVMKWNDCLVKFRIIRDEQVANRDPVAKMTQYAMDTAAEEKSIPRRVGKDGWVHTKLPLMFKAKRSLSAPLKQNKFPASFDAKEFAGGYLFQNQTVIGLDTEGKSLTKVVKDIDAILTAFRARGTPMINMMGEGHKYPYFLHSGNPLVFVWLMPEKIYRDTPFAVADVRFSAQVESKADAKAAEDVRAKQKADREAFEAAVAQDEIYKSHMRKADVERQLGDITASMQWKLKADKRREEIRQEHIAKAQGDQPKLKTPQLSDRVYAPKKKTTRVEKINKAAGKFEDVIASDIVYLQLQAKVEQAQSALEAARNNKELTDARINATTAQHDETKDARTEARKEWKRLVEAGASKAAIDKARQKLEAAKAQAHEAQKARDASVKGLSVEVVNSAAVKAAMEKIKQAILAVEEARAAAKARYDELWEQWEGKPKPRKRDTASVKVPKTVKAEPAAKVGKFTATLRRR
jgi:hypothetical protein